ncbi:MAG TPA: hypothetical protein DGG94_11280 [Micromonosporaceae bacterium]|nr:hypothetical protein [Micromonosporaceae bacterium]HCU50362.1 hypothetical protein [Micromonosporaceae bacterium]
MTTLRPYFAWALLTYAAAELFFIFLNWLLISGGTNIFQRSYRTDTTTLTTVGLPMLAVLITTQVKPVLSIAKNVALVALAEYLIILLFGGLTFLLGLIHMIDFVQDTQSQVAALSYLVFGLLGFVLAGLSAFVTWRIYTSPAQATV